MQAINKHFAKIILLVSFALTFVAPTAYANGADETPSAVAMTVDGLVVRPVTFVATVAGAAIWTVTLPFSLLGGNAMEAGEVLVGTPFKATFVRPLGHNITGRKVEFEEFEEE